MPIAYYRYYHLEFDVFHYYAHMMTVGPWSAGSAWFLWVLLTFDAFAAAIFAVAPRAIAALGRLVDGISDSRLLHSPHSRCSRSRSTCRYGSRSANCTGRRRPLSVFHPEQPRAALCRVFPRRRRCRSGGLRKGMLDEGGAIARRRRTWSAIALPATQRSCAGLHPSQRNDRFAFAAAVVARDLRRRLRAVLCGDDLRRAGVFPSLAKRPFAFSTPCSSRPMAFISCTSFR